MPAQIFRRTILLLALAALPGFAAAAGSQAGDNGRLPLGADNEGPRQAIPNATTNDGTLYNYDGSVYYVEPYYGPHRYGPYYVPSAPYSVPPSPYYVPPSSYYTPPSYYGPTYHGQTYSGRDFGRALLFCDSRPLAERAACRDAVYAGRF